MRYLTALLIAFALLFLFFWGGSQIAIMVEQPQRRYNDFTVGRKMDLCGYAVDMRHGAGGYDLYQWEGERCDGLSDLDECILSCLSEAGTVEIGTACFSTCLDD